MSKSQENRKTRRKRNKKFLLRLAHKKFDKLVYRNRGVSPKYYDVCFDRIVTRMVGNRRMFDLTRMSVHVTPNQRYFDTIRQLIKMAGNVKVYIPKEARE